MKVKITLTALLVLLLSVMTVEASGAEIVGGPYLCNPRMDGMTVGWVADTANAGQVDYGKTKAYGNKAVVTLCDRIVQKPKVKTQRFACRVRLRKLVPGVTYYYKVSGKGLSGQKEGQFRIPKRDEPHLTVFQTDDCALTDLGLRFVEKKVGRAADLLVDGGDTVQRGRDYYDFKAQLYRRLPLVVAKSNHEHDWPDKQANLHHFDYENCTAENLEHVIDYGAVRWILGPYVRYSDNFTQKQLTWIEEQLKSTERKWKFYACHHIFFSDGYHADLRWGTKAGEGKARRQSVWPLFMKYDMRLAVNGHDHAYQRTFPIDKDGNKTLRGTVNLDVAIGGSIQRRQSPWMARFIGRGKDKDKRITGVTYLYVSGEKATVEFYTYPKKDPKLEDFKLADRFTFSTKNFHQDAMAPGPSNKAPRKTK
ncbi:MAG: metallophosphoesterase family protein [Phycisphaerales bacterium]|nr:metallophosphoesterase family protein [Phycisphaerales bacterium]